MSAVIDCLEFRAKGGTRRWLLVHHPGALMQEAEYEWAADLEQATRFEDGRAEWLKANAAELPWLPTEPPMLPANIRVVYGHYSEPEPLHQRPAPEVVQERERRYADRTRGIELSIPPEEVYHQTAVRLGEHDE